MNQGNDYSKYGHQSGGPADLSQLAERGLQTDREQQEDDAQLAQDLEQAHVEVHAEPLEEDRIAD